MPLNSASVGATASMQVNCDARWLMAYSAAVGWHSPIAFDTTRHGGVRAHPMFSVAPEWALLTSATDPFRLGLTRTERAAGVHADHHLVQHRAVRQGDELALRAEVVGIESIGSGALVAIRFDASDADGCAVWTSWMGSVYRGVGVIGESVTATRPQVVRPDRTAEVIEVEHAVAPGDAHIYTECARIWNPIHTDVGVARAAGLPDIILHGTATMAFGVTAVMRQLGLEPDDVTEIAGSFRAMVLMPSRLTIAVSDSATLGRATSGICPFEVRTANGEPAIRDALVGFRRR